MYLSPSVPLSLTVPVTEDRYETSRWTDGLLPDRLDVREQWARRYKAASQQPFDMLATPIGLDCAGAVQFCSPDQTNDLQQRTGGLVPVKKEKLAGHLTVVDHESGTDRVRGHFFEHVDEPAEFVLLFDAPPAAAVRRVQC